MIAFKQNNEITYDDKELMEENSFIGAAVDTSPLPIFSEEKGKLPQPIWENHKDYIDCYWKAWEIAFKNLGQPKEGTGFIKNYIDAAFNDCIFMVFLAYKLITAGNSADTCMPRP